MIRAAAPSTPYDYLPSILARIDRGEGDALLPAAIRGYVQLGLYGPARELLDRLDPVALQSPDLAALRQTLTGQHTGQLSWNTCAGRLGRNLDVLVRRDERFAAIAEAWNAARDAYELYRTTDGNYQLCRRDSQNRRCWLGGLADHKQWAGRQPLQHDQRISMPNPYLLEGLGHGHYFRRVYDTTQDTFLGFSCALYVLERDPVAFAIALNLHDWRQVFADPRVMVFVGHDCLDRLATVLEADPDLPLPLSCVQLPRWSPELDPKPIDTVSRITAQRRHSGDEALARIEAQYAGRDTRYWAKRFAEALGGQGPPLRILSAVSIHTTFLQYSMRDAHHAFEQLGCRTRLLTEQSNHHVISETAYHRAIEEFDPDLFFLIDHLRGGHERLLPANLPMFTWDQDSLPQTFNRRVCATIGPLDVIAGLGKRHAVRALGVPRDKCLLAHVPTSLETFNPQRLPDHELAPYACDVSYVSNASQTPEEFHDEQRGQLEDDAGRDVLDQLYQMIRRAAGGPQINGHRGNELIHLIEGETGLQLADEFRNWLSQWYLWRLVDRIFRHQTLDWVAQWATQRGRTLHLYGHGWDNHPTLGPFARGFARNGHELRCIHQASAINLQVFPGGFIHQRAIDGLASGGFFLTRRTMADMDGPVVRRLCRRCDDLGINSTRQLLESPDPELQAALRAYREWSADPMDPDDPTLLPDLRMQAEHFTAVDVFPRFKDIVFDDQASFVALADRFVDDADLRAELTGGMHQAVVKHFSYDRQMQRFLQFHADYLKGRAQAGAVG
ncbi:MAG TPA: hypothetical protein VM243_09510 [Phycisphaerae bacterium]|nr:hypothetical protein [Phycisphaerae bacterium]